MFLVASNIYLQVTLKNEAAAKVNLKRSQEIVCAGMTFTERKNC